MGSFKLGKKKVNIWVVLSTVFTILIVAPSLNIFINIFGKGNENWNHIVDNMLGSYIQNSLWLMVFTGVGTLLIGVSLAWLVTMYEFPFRNFLKWALVLPLTIPPNIGAYTYYGMLGYTGVIQSTLRNRFDISLSPGALNIANINGAVFIFIIFLFPYVYMITKSFFEKNVYSLVENSRVLGRGAAYTFFKVAIPVSRGAIVSSVTLVVLELLNDYGVVQYFGIPAFSTAIFTTWFSMGDLNTAVRLSSILMSMALTLVLLEKVLRGRRKYSETNSRGRRAKRKILDRKSGIIVSLFGFTVFALGFGIPVVQMVNWAVKSYMNVLSPEFLGYMANSVWMGVIGAAIIAVVSLVIGNYNRMSNSFVSKLYSKVTILGYSIPGAVIAVGVIVSFIALDNALYPVYGFLNPDSKKLVLSSSVAMLGFAYVVRFLGVGFGPIESGYDRMGTRYLEASRTLGMNTVETFFKIDIPILKGSIMTALSLVFLEIIKELPLTLILRPFNFHTLATRSYQYANDEMLPESAVPSLLIVTIGLLSVYMIQNAGRRKK